MLWEWEFQWEEKEKRQIMRGFIVGCDNYEVIYNRLKQNIWKSHKLDTYKAAAVNIHTVSLDGFYRMTNYFDLKK